MGSRQIRVGQLIAPFGPGSLYTDKEGTPLVIAGLDYWYCQWDEAGGKMSRENTHEDDFVFSEPRLSDLLHVNKFRLPPDYRTVHRGQEAPPNANLRIPALRFPSWYRHTRDGRLKRFNLATKRIPIPEGGGRWQPVRFIAVCEAGHLCEFPWKRWINCDCDHEDGLFLVDRGGADLKSITVRCSSCSEGSDGKRGKSLSGTTTRPDNSDNGTQTTAFQRVGISCSGGRPWLGEDPGVCDCSSPLAGALINQTNIYSARTISALALPDLNSHGDINAELRQTINDCSKLGLAKTIWQADDQESAVAVVQAELEKMGLEEPYSSVHEILDALFSPLNLNSHLDMVEPSQPESRLLSFRREEYAFLRNPLDEPVYAPELRIIQASVAEDISGWFSRVNLVERLQETRAFFGFDRISQSQNPLDEMPDSAMQQLFREPPKDVAQRWLPAIKVFGEGIYLEFNEDQLRQWQTDNAEWIKDRLTDDFVKRIGDVYQTLPPVGALDREWASRYLLVHSTAHILINQLVYECGYSSAALRERLFVSSDPRSPMASFLIYTAAGDSEGTLGGLVRLGREDRLNGVVKKALARAGWCSADPICSENLGGQGARLANLSACHACMLLPETACETINHGLDRAMLIGTPESPEVGYFSVAPE